MLVLKVISFWNFLSIWNHLYLKELSFPTFTQILMKLFRYMWANNFIVKYFGNAHFQTQPVYNFLATVSIDLAQSVKGKKKKKKKKKQTLSHWNISAFVPYSWTMGLRIFHSWKANERTIFLTLFITIIFLVTVLSTKWYRSTPGNGGILW